MPPFHRLVLPIMLPLAALSAGMAAVAQTTRVENTATLSFRTATGETASVRSNTVTLPFSHAKRPTRISFRLPPPGYQLTGARCDLTPSPQYTPAPIDAATLASAPPLAAFDLSHPMIFVLDAPGANRDPAIRDTANIDISTPSYNGEIPIMETAPDSGVFAGGVPQVGTQAELKPCEAILKRGERLSFSYSEDNFSFSSDNSLLIDPAGYVFDSRDGTLVDGAIVSLVDANGAPATVFGVDGISRYPSTVVSGQEVTDASGRVYVADKGRYWFPLTLPGTYTIRIQPPGDYTAPSVVPRGELAKLTGSNGAYVINDASFGLPFVLETPDPFLTDIPLDRPGSNSLLLTKTASVRDASPGDFVQYRLQLSNRGDAPARALKITDTLPTGLRYERGSTRGAAEPDVASDGRTLSFTVPDVGVGGSVDVNYVVSIAPGAPVGEALNRARVAGSGVTSNEAAASVRLRALLFSDAMTLIGRVTEGACGDPVDKRKGVPGIRLMMEDGTFTVTDKDGLYHVEGLRAGRHVVQLDENSLPATHRAVACDADTRAAGSAISRFVEGVGGTLKRVDFQLEPTGRTAAATDALPVAVDDAAAAAGNRDWLSGQTPGTGWLFPAADHNPRDPALRVVIKHAPSERIALSVDGMAVEALAYDGSDTAPDGGVAVSKWTGVSLHAGDNLLTARVLDADGKTVTTLERTVHYAGAGVRATFDAAKSRLIADGLTRPLIAVRVVDKDNRPVRAGTPVPFRLDQPYRAAVEAALEQRRQLAGREKTETLVNVVGDDGYAFIALEPTTQAGAVHATVLLTEEKTVRSSEIRAWLSGAAKQWSVVGFGAGTIGYDTLKSRSTALPRSERNKLITDGQLAVYAKGRIKGQWLLTMAYDSDRAYDPQRGLLGVIDPDRYYTVYGDGTVQGYDAPTRRKLYLRLERRELYALFGDFETGFTDTQLTRYSRTLNGVKAAYEGPTIRATGFAAKTDTLYARDEIQGNGLSGPYRLSTRRIVPNSDKLRIETRDRFRSELILDTRQLTRHIDYDIDTSAGTVRFRSPILSRDGNQNPVFIVADYEVEGGRTSKLAAAARVAARVGRVEIGTSMIRDETVAKSTVVGADLKAKLGVTELRAELAAGGRGGIGAGTAYLVEADTHTGGIDVLAYARQQDAMFGVGQQNLVEAGTRKLGVDGRLKLSDRLSVTGTAWYQTQLVGPGERIAADARVEYRRNTGTLYAGTQIASDRGLDGRDRDSRLLTLGGTQALFGDKLTLGAETQIAPGGDKASTDFPERTRVTAGYRITPGIRLIGGYEIASGRDFVAHTAQAGFDLTPWSGAKLSSTLNQQAAGENGSRTFAQYGLSQSVPIGTRWTIDATVDAANTVKGNISPLAAVNAFQPAASGGFLSQTQTNGDYAALTLGATYRGPRWSWNGRAEYRDADTEQRLGFTSNLLRALGEGQTLASSVRAYRVRDEAGRIAATASADVALALRPLDSRWSVLERLELRHERADSGFSAANALGVPSYRGGDQVTDRVVNNLALNYRTGPEGLSHGTEATLYYGAKYVRGRFADDVYDGFIDVAGFELRHDLAKRFDIGVQGSVSHAWDRGVWSWSGGPSAGVTPGGNVWVSAGYNIGGYRDRDFSADRYTRKGPYVTMRVKFDQWSLKSVAGRLFGQRP